MIADRKTVAPGENGGAQSGRGLPHSKTLPRSTSTSRPNASSWSAPVLWRFGAARLPREAEIQQGMKELEGMLK